VTVLSRLPDTN